MPLDVARCRALLAPWRAQVELAKSCLTMFSSMELALPSLAPAARPAFFLRLREAFELLEMLAVAEQLSWGDMLAALRSSRPTWGYSTLQPASNESAFVPAGLFLTRKDRYYSGPDVVELAAIYFAFDERSMSADFRAARHEIHAAASPEARRRLAQQEPKPVVLSFSMRSAPKTASHSAFLRAIGDLAKRLTARANQPTGPTCDSDREPQQQQEQEQEVAYRFPFTFKRMEVTGVGQCSVHDPDVSAALTALVALGVHLDDIALGATSWFMRTPIAQLGPVLQGFTNEAALRAARGVDALLVRRGSRVQLRVTSCMAGGAERRLSAPRARERERQLGAVFSALATLRDVAELGLSAVHLTTTPRDRVGVLKWITYALFSKDAAASASTVDFCLSPCTADEISAVTRVLAAKNPARALLALDGDAVADASRVDSAAPAHSSDHPTPSASTPPPAADEDDRDLGFAVLKAGTRVRIKPLGLAGEPEEAFELAQDGRFRVVQDAASERDMVELLVPCYGHCLVARASIERIDSDSDAADAADVAASSLAVGYRGPIEALRVTETDFAVVLPFVRFVGARLFDLAIFDVGVTNDDIRSVLAACPNLTTLSLSAVEAGVDQLFADAYACGACRLESLSLEGFRLDELGGRANALVQALEEPTTAAARTLRQLSVFNMEPSVVGEAEFSAYVRMLAANRTLEYLTINVLNGRLKARQWMLTKTHGLWLPGQSLGLRSKCAFLSVVRSHSAAAGDERARKRARVGAADRGVDMGRLDSSVVALIFRFAAAGVSRKVEVNRYDYDSDDDEHGGDDGDDSDEDPWFNRRSVHGFW